MSTNTPKNPNQRYHVPNLKRALEVLELLAKKTSGMTLPEISKAIGHSKSTIFRIICTLEDCGYVCKNADERIIRLSRKLLALGYASFGEDNIVEKSMDIIRIIRDETGETAMLGTMLEDDCVLIEQAPGKQPFKFLGEVGMRIPFTTSAPGKAMLAFVPSEEKQRRLAKLDFIKHNENTICDLESFKIELDKVVKCGYAVDNSEEIIGVNCVGAPIFDAHGYPVAAIWITGPSERVRPENLDTIGKAIRKHADTISARLGYYNWAVI